LSRFLKGGGGGGQECLIPEKRGKKESRRAFLKVEKNETERNKLIAKGKGRGEC